MDPPSLTFQATRLEFRSYGGQAAKISPNEVVRRGRKKPTAEERKLTQIDYLRSSAVVHVLFAFRNDVEQGENTFSGVGPRSLGLGRHRDTTPWDPDRIRSCEIR